jgi:predicted dithiol-disulfide oxidoreductase (DUF899 family)
VSGEEWLAARKKPLGREKQLARDAICASRHKLPWMKVDKKYVFESPKGQETLADRFEGSELNW